MHSEKNDANSRIIKYLQSYEELKYAPGYAIMIAGSWGTGKTHFIKKYISRNHDQLKGNEYIYISLYGLKSRDEIDEALFRAVYPRINNRATNITKKIGKGVMKFFRLDIDISQWDILDKFTPKLHIFDDFERCGMPAAETFGYINDFVEHGDIKVIIMCNEDEIANKENYERIKEKVVGKTFKLVADPQGAIKSFCEKIQNRRLREIIQGSDTVMQIYLESRIQSLRILEQSIRDVDMIYDKLKEDTTAQCEPDVIFTMIALFMEKTAGRLHQVDISQGLKDILEYELSSSPDRIKPNLLEILERHKSVDIRFVIDNYRSVRESVII